ncbi:motility protein B [Anaerotignum neopropionicum]|uniref:Motility protein B n=1 Tax=Anaerotignum neopropionicum TaxID=36847 RepID=A0A136WJC5_9FIRM|nr:flagellar motor protein MotB [Anaerotignum neopropionicum]KXL54543.1 motility protein B [Anaerotignum neopropionicum]
MKKKDKKGKISTDWLNTYSDMVTLLLCFFVLLYSISSVDSSKWEKIVRSFNPTDKEVSQIVENSEGSLGNYDLEGGFNGDGEDTNFNDEFDELYYKLSKYVEMNGLDSDVEISKGEGFTFITFRNNIFFDGDSYILKQEGKDVLDQLCYAIEDVSSSVKEIQILGHTSQASPTIPNEIVSDRFLSANRATEVLVYIQKKNIIGPEKLVSTGFGQFRPISSFETRESRAKNRRVEILITKNDSVVRSLDNYYNEIYGIEADEAQTQNTE